MKWPNHEPGSREFRALFRLSCVALFASAFSLGLAIVALLRRLQ